MSTRRPGVVPHPPADVARYRAAGWWQADTIPIALRRTWTAHPDRLAVATDERRITFGELDRRTDQIAAGLLDAGLRPGDAVTLQLENTAEAVEIWYGLLKAGLVPVCTLSRHRHHEIDEIARITGARAHVSQVGARGPDAVAFSRELAERVPSVEHLLLTRSPEPVEGMVQVEALGRDVDPAIARKVVDDAQHELSADEPAVFQLSGGTTARPKVIPRLHAEYLYNVRARIDRWQIDAADVMGYVLPLVHNAGIQTSLHVAHLVGIPLVLAEPLPEVFLPLFTREGVTRALLPVGFAATLADDPAMAPMARQLRMLGLSLGKVPPSLFDALTALGPTVVQEFGMGEGLIMTHCLDDPEAVRRTTVGTPISPGDEIELRDEAGRPVPPGTPGELHVRGPYTLRGYLAEDERNAVAFDAAGFYDTGDVMIERTIEGRTAYELADRTKDLINRGGEKVNAAEVEMLLLEHPAVREAAVVAMPDERLGERACAFLVTTGEAIDLAGVQAHLDELDVAKYKWPERVEVIDELPRTAVGKVAKAALRDRVRDLLGATGGGA